jgi:hypothetical protein
MFYFLYNNPKHTIEKIRQNVAIQTDCEKASHICTLASRVDVDTLMWFVVDMRDSNNMVEVFISPVPSEYLPVIRIDWMTFKNSLARRFSS